jgi:hypothetical protein
LSTEDANGYVSATIEKALTILRKEAAAAYYRLARELDGMCVFIEVGEERFQLRCTETSIAFSLAAGASDVLVRTQPATILALIDGKIGVMDCVLAGELDLRAGIDALPHIARATVAFSEGAIRSRGMRALLASFRKTVLLQEAVLADQSFRSIM